MAGNVLTASEGEVTVEHLWGIRAIARRLGYKNPKSFYLAYAQGRVFAYKRRDPRDSRRVAWYSNEGLIQLVELTLAKQQREVWLAEREEKRLLRMARQNGNRQEKQGRR
jgi:hypothetical protein